MKKKHMMTLLYKQYLQLWLVTGLICSFPVLAFAELEEAGKIIAFGDSLTEGCDVYTGECGWERSGDLGYDVELESQLQKSFRNYLVQNFGIGGSTAYEGMGRVDSVIDELCNEGAEYILILLGTNDLFHGAREEDVQYYLSVIVDKSKGHGLAPLLATIPPDPDHRYKNIPFMNEYIRALASDENIPLVELYNEMYPAWSSYTPGCYGDNLHPNAAGFKVMGGIWFESLADLIQPSPPSPPPLNRMQLLLDQP